GAHRGGARRAGPLRGLPPRLQLPRAPRLPGRVPDRLGAGGGARGGADVGGDGGGGAPVDRRGAGRHPRRGPRRGLTPGVEFRTIGAMTTMERPAVDDLARVRYASANGIRIAYETFGDPSDPAILLVMGLGTQMIAWPDEMCAMLAEAGHHVVRFDNRDVGLSTHLDLPAPQPHEVVLRRRRPPYTVSDMANDAVGLLDALDIEAAHVVGASMGGFISQTVAL